MTSLREVEWQISYGPSDDRLNTFYIPALQRAVQYDRSTGFFSSSSLAVAGAGVAGLVANGGSMRLLVGAQLSREDVDAIARGASLEGIVTDKLITALDQPVEDLLRRRLEILAWMIAHGTLQIKVVLPRDANGLPIPAESAQDYYHPKEGLFTDAEGHQVAFSGSINESMTGWQRNYEQFSVYFSWDTSRPYLRQVAIRFDRVWEGREDDWIAFDIPQAARDALLRLVPANAPEHDPLAPAAITVNPSPDKEAELRRERLIFQFIRDIPYFPNAKQLGAATCAITPWPHQMRVAQKIIDTYPKRYMLCDEVGLGKTIEAGLVLRQLVISGRVKRALLLVPKSVSRQWQEELYEKFVLDVPLFEGGRFWNYAGEELDWQYDTANPWDAFDMFIASSQLAKRRDRYDEVTSARPWDLVMVDEAHHARRRAFLQPIYRPNRLLALLTAPNFQANAILLMTATPMQVHPLEVWDLLKVLGLGGKWGADEGNFMRFYLELMKPFEDVDWDFVYEMVEDYLEYGGQIDPEFAERARNALGFVDWNSLQQLPRDPHPSRAMRPLLQTAKPFVAEMARRHTPLRDMMFRNTRDLLREYVRQGLLNENVPTRDPQLVWIPMRPEEMRLYLRIEEYISDFYRKYENERKGLGFVMTVYRRRLTSSFYAVRQSLERRLEFLEGRAEQAFDDDDLEQADLEQDVTEILDDDQRSLYQEEIDYVESFISDLQQLSVHDSKTEQLIQDLTTIFRQRETAIIFTQYTDTMDYLRDKLLQVYGSQVACYSGRGGEIWNGIAWVGVTKEDIKQTFRAGEDVKILVCTEAASEGLNLQTCGVLINYDMPWNPMRVEQRIGRIDRIGQIHDEVWIRNYFYEETVEARVYQALAHRINWFEGVVGDLQPILARVGRAIERIVMATPDEREQVLAGELDDIERGLDQRDSDILNVYEGSESVHPWSGLAAPITLPELESSFLESSYFGHQIAPNPDIETTYLVTTSQGQTAITFNPETFDRYPNSLRLFSYGDRVLDELLSRVPTPEEDERQGIVCFSSADSVPLKAYYGLNQQNQPVRLQTLQDLLNVIEDASGNSVWSETAFRWAKQDFERHLHSAREEFDSITNLRFQATHSALVENAVQIVYRATLLELMQSGHFSNLDDAWRAATTNEHSSQSLLRHGYPFTALLRLTAARIGGSNIPDPIPDNFANANSEQLRRMFLNLKQEGQTLLERLGMTQDRQETGTQDSFAIDARFLRG